MKLKRTFLLLATLKALCTSSGCNKPFENAPFQCTINGKGYWADSEAITATNDMVFGSNRFHINANVRSATAPHRDAGEIELFFGVDSTGLYELSLQNAFVWTDRNGDVFRSSIYDPGTLNITTFELNNHHVTGNYELTVYADNNNASIVVSDGFLDIIWD